MIWPSKKALLLSGVAVGGGTLAIMTAGVAAPAVGMLVGIVAGSAGLSVLKRCGFAGGCGCCAEGASCAEGTSCATGAPRDADNTTTVGGAGALDFSALSDSDDDVLLKVMASKLREEISELKQNLNDSKNSRFFERGDLLQELAEKESKLKNIGDTLSATVHSRSDG